MRKKRTKTISTNDVDYGCVWNGGHFRGITIGNGYDVTIKRESEHTAIASIKKAGKENVEYLTILEIEVDADLQELAIYVGQRPESEEWNPKASPDDDNTDYWDDLANRWNAIKFR